MSLYDRITKPLKAPEPLPSPITKVPKEKLNQLVEEYKGKAESLSQEEQQWLTEECIAR